MPLFSSTSSSVCSRRTPPPLVSQLAAAPEIGASVIGLAKALRRPVNTRPVKQGKEEGGNAA